MDKYLFIVLSTSVPFRKKAVPPSDGSDGIELCGACYSNKNTDKFGETINRIQVLNPLGFFYLE